MQDSDKPTTDAPITLLRGMMTQALQAAQMEITKPRIEIGGWTLEDWKPPLSTGIRERWWRSSIGGNLRLAALAAPSGRYEAKTPDGKMARHGYTPTPAVGAAIDGAMQLADSAIEAWARPPGEVPTRAGWWLIEDPFVGGFAVVHVHEHERRGLEVFRTADRMNYTLADFNGRWIRELDLHEIAGGDR